MAIRTSFSFAAAVCRDEKGHILFVFSKRFPPSSPLVGEARAALMAAQEAFHLPSSRVLLEGDSLFVIEAINNRSNGAIWQIANVVADIHRLASQRELWKFCHVKRGANALAHKIVQWLCSANLEGYIPISCIPVSILSSDNPWIPP